MSAYSYLSLMYCLCSFQPYYVYISFGLGRIELLNIMSLRVRTTTKSVQSLIRRKVKWRIRSACYIFSSSFLFSDFHIGGNVTSFLDENEECPRKSDLIENRKCFKKCHTSKDCRGRSKRCLCDDTCGKSCVKPRKSW